MIQNRFLALIFRVFSFIFVFLGIGVTTNLFTGNFSLGSFMYYTLQSNLLALIMFGILIVKTYKGLKNNGTNGSAGYVPRFEMVCVIDLLLTLIVYWVMLAPQSFSMDGGFSLWNFSNISVHLVSPLLCLIDYILFTESNVLKYKDIYAVVIYPIAYVIFTCIAGFSGYVFRTSGSDGRPVRFPYFFYDFDRLGLKSFIYIFILIIIFIVIGHIFYFFDKKITKRVLFSNKK